MAGRNKFIKMYLASYHFKHCVSR